MPRQNNVLLVLPEQHLMIYASCVAREILGYSRTSAHVQVLAGQEAVPDRIDRALAEEDPALFFGVGHGSPEKYTVECSQPYIDAGRTSVMRGRIVVLNSCRTAQLLGPELVNSGAAAYFGNEDDFWFYVGTPPCSDRASRAVFLAEHQALKSLLEGKSAGVAREEQLRRYEEEIDWWVTGLGRADPRSPLIARLLHINMSASVLLGSADAKAVTTPPVAVPPIIGLLGLAPALTVFSVVCGSEITKLIKQRL